MTDHDFKVPTASSPPTTQVLRISIAVSTLVVILLTTILTTPAIMLCCIQHRKGIQSGHDNDENKHVEQSWKQTEDTYDYPDVDTVTVLSLELKHMESLILHKSRQTWNSNAIKYMESLINSTHGKPLPSIELKVN